VQQVLNNHPDAASIANATQFEVPVILVRDDGVIFSTGKSYTFTMDALSRA